MVPETTFLAPGQRYMKAGGAGWRADLQLLVLGIDRDPEHGLCVTYRCPGGRLVRGAAVEFEIAVAVGDIVPVVAAGQVACC